MRINEQIAAKLPVGNFVFCDGFNSGAPVKILDKRQVNKDASGLKIWQFFIQVSETDTDWWWCSHFKLPNIFEAVEFLEASE